jgi:hypothetical protein
LHHPRTDSKDLNNNAAAAANIESNKHSLDQLNTAKLLAKLDASMQKKALLESTDYKPQQRNHHQHNASSFANNFAVFN